MAKLDLDEVHRLIRTEKDPAALQAKLRAAIEEAHPVPAFRRGERILMHEFERRFKDRFCGGVEPAFRQWPVMVIWDEVDGELLLCLGITADGEKLPGEVAQKFSPVSRDSEK